MESFVDGMNWQRADSPTTFVGGPPTDFVSDRDYVRLEGRGLITTGNLSHLPRQVAWGNISVGVDWWGTQLCKTGVHFTSFWGPSAADGNCTVCFGRRRVIETWEKRVDFERAVKVRWSQGKEKGRPCAYSNSNPTVEVPLVLRLTSGHVL